MRSAPIWRRPIRAPWSPSFKRIPNIKKGAGQHALLPSVCRKSLAEFAPAGAKKVKSVFGRGVYVDENTSRPANARTGLLGAPQKPSASGFCGERRRKEAHAVFTARWKRRKADFAPTKCAAAGRIRRGWGFVPGERLSKILFRQSQRSRATCPAPLFDIISAPQSWLPAGPRPRGHR